MCKGKCVKNDEDIQLMLRFKEGDGHAFAEIFNKYKKGVLNTIYRIIGNKDEAEDLSQEVFLKIYNAGRRYRADAEFKTYLNKIVVNTSISYLRRKKILQFVSLDIFSKDKEQQGKTLDPEDIQMRKELKSVIKNAILQLPTNQRIALTLKIYNNLSYEEIANIIDLTPQAVKSLIFRAKENLKRILKNYISE